MARAETKIRAGLRMASVWCFRPSAAAPPRFTPCWPTAQDYNSSQHRATTKNLFGAKQHNKNRLRTKRRQDERQYEIADIVEAAADGTAGSAAGAGIVCGRVRQETCAASAATSATGANPCHAAASGAAGDQQFHSGAF